ncbi:hypothetical protein M8J77_012053 [Diaphorina citri]|nr:hypothetical protein M8J77_012053 [Diaphorina citri]
MGVCTKRFYLLLLCVLQFMTTSARQIFDFLGFMWAPILMNFFLLLFTIFGFFGACQYKTKYILSYCIWNVVWVVWNLFIVCFYLNLLGLDRNSDILNFGTGSVSWWESNGPRCKAIFHANKSNIEEDPFRPVRPDLITGCVLDYQYVETLQAWLQIILSIIGASVGFAFRKDILRGDDDDDFGFLGSFGAQVNPHHVALHPIVLFDFIFPVQPSKSSKKVKGPPPLYSIEYSARQDNRLDDTTSEPSDGSALEDDARYSSSSRPMTPRRVKRRSVGSRPPPPPTLTAPPLYLRRGAGGGSTRSSRRHRSHQNPVTKLLQQQQQAINTALNDSSTSADSFRHPYSSSQSTLLYPGAPHPTLGHPNPGYLSVERPPSARSSYSNYHGTRAFSYSGAGGVGPQVPTNQRRSTFLSNGPPAYHSQCSVNSETVI